MRTTTSRILSVLRERVACPRRLDLVEMREHLLDGAPLLDEREGALVADPLHARDVVRAVAHDRQHVDHVGRIGAELLAHRSEALDLGRLAGLEDVVELHALADELQEVLVAGDEEDLVAEALALLRQRADHVVGFDPRHLVERHAVGLDHAPDQRQLRQHLLRGLLARRLVVREARVAEGGALGVERHGHEVGLLLLEDAPQRHRESVRGARGRAVARGEA